MAMHINAARHNDPTSGIDNFFRKGIRFNGGGYNFAIFDPDITNFAVDTIDWVVNFPALNPCNRHPMHLLDKSLFKIKISWKLGVSPATSEEPSFPRHAIFSHRLDREIQKQDATE